MIFKFLKQKVILLWVDGIIILSHSQNVLKEAIRESSLNLT